MDDIVIRAVGVLRTCYAEKFGVPRQPGLVREAWGEVVLEPEYAKAEAVRGLEQFSHLWLVTLFHLVPEEHAALTARPPRLGGNDRVGVFASRTPYRPNRIGLSVVELVGISNDEGGVRIRVRGIDWVDGTPVLDIKPYVPYADAVQNAAGGYASAPPSLMNVRWQCPPPGDEISRCIIEDSVALSPQPSYHDPSGRVYAACIAGHEIKWEAGDAESRILFCAPVTLK